MLFDYDLMYLAIYSHRDCKVQITLDLKSDERRKMTFVGVPTSL